MTQRANFSGEPNSFERVVLDGNSEGVAFFVNGRQVSRIDKFDPKNIKLIDIVKNDPKYPNGAVYITLKDGLPKEWPENK